MDVDLRLSEVMAALSHALDISDGHPAGHATRTCLIGMRIADDLDLEAADRSALFYGLLLKDLGCSSNAARPAPRCTEPTTTSPSGTPRGSTRHA